LAKPRGAAMVAPNREEHDAMAKYVMVVQSKAVEGQDAGYNEWYDTIHMEDILDLPGVNSGRRFDFDSTMMGAPGQPYLAIYEIETDDINTVTAEMGKRAMDGKMRQTDTLDAPASVLWFYKERAAA
jgi:hypothetical protein